MSTSKLSRIALPILSALTCVIHSFTPSSVSASELVSAPAYSYEICPSAITIGDNGQFEPGDTILIIQMQGASIDFFEAPGSIIDLNGCGQWEFAIIRSVEPNKLNIRNALNNNYNFSGSVQVVKVITGDNITITSPLQAKYWDGAHGGVVPIIARDTLFLSSIIHANGRGFSGGELRYQFYDTGNSTVDNFGSMDNPRLSSKGDGVWKSTPNDNSGAAPSGNGGGGGNSHNAGGAGGGHLTRGGNGGNQFLYYNVKNAYSGHIPSSWNIGGDRLFMGGGGGAGHQNGDQDPIPNTGTRGASGGGIVIIFAPVIVASNNAVVSAMGESVLFTAGPDGAGGGGAGGSVLINSQTIIGNLTAVAIGGAGGFSDFNDCVGPGGGGAGGVIISNQTLNTYVLGGSNGSFTLESARAKCKSHGSEPGEQGLVLKEARLSLANKLKSYDGFTNSLIPILGATNVNDSVYLTKDTSYTSGIAWIERSLHYHSSNKLSFTLNMSSPGRLTPLKPYLPNAADGIAILICSDTTGFSNSLGSQIGYGNAPNCVAIELDMYQNEANGDPENDHVAIQIPAGGSLSAKHTPTRTPFIFPLEESFVADNRPYSVYLEFDSTNTTLRIDDLDSNKNIFSASIEFSIKSHIVNNTGRIFIGFSSSTGDQYQNHVISNVSLCSSAQIPTSVDEQANNEDVKSQLTIYPNPAQTSFRVQGLQTTEPVIVTISDMQGRIYRKQAVESLENYTFLTESYPTGMYIVSIETIDGKRISSLLEITR